jgi:RNA polymerase sigma-70 factor (ECF subfamily)
MPAMRVDTERVGELLTCMRAGDVERLVGLLAPDVVLLGDGGGRVAAINRPLVGSDTVARFLVAMAGMEPTAEARFATLNGQAAVLAYLRGALESVFVFDTTSAGVMGIYVVRNPEKLRRLAERTANA